MNNNGCLATCNIICFDHMLIKLILIKYVKLEVSDWL